MKHEEEVLVCLRDAIVCGQIVELHSDRVRLVLADAENPYAVAHLYDLLEKPLCDIPVVYAQNMEMVSRLTERLNEKAQTLAARFWPGPLDLVLPASSELPDIVTDAMSHVLVRVPEDPFLQELLDHVSRPLAVYEYPCPQQPLAGKDHSKAGVVICSMERKNLACVEPLTILFDPGDRPYVHSFGEATHEEIESLIGAYEVCEHGDIPSCLQKLGFSRFRPETPLAIIDASTLDIGCCKKSRIGYLAFGNPAHKSVFSIVKSLSVSGDPVEAAAMLYPSIRRLHAMDLRLVLAEFLPESGLGSEINHRLRLAGFDFPGLKEQLGSEC
jgi:L-threonylcarbamoyladenylate synthase